MNTSNAPARRNAVDVTRAPIIVVRAPTDDTPTVDDVEAQLAAFEEAVEPCERFITIFHPPSTLRVPAEVRHAQAAWVARTEPLYKGRYVAAIFLLPSRFLRGALRAMFWLKPPYYEVVVCTSIDEAWNAALRIADREGIDVPEG